MKRQELKLICAAIMLTWAASIAAADIKIKTKNTTGAMSFQSTTWIKGARLRTAQGIGLDSIDQCDLNLDIELAGPAILIYHHVNPISFWTVEKESELRRLRNPSERETRKEPSHESHSVERNANLAGRHDISMHRLHGLFEGI